MRQRAGRAATALRSTLPRRPRPAIVTYHRIAEETFDPWCTAVAPARFAGHLSWLSRRRTVLPLAEFAARHTEGTLPIDAVAVTFDDGYSCNSDVAAPMLEHFRIPATIFLPAALIDEGRAFWWDELEDIVLESNRSSLRVDESELALGPASSADRHWNPGAPPRTPRQRAYHRIQRLLVIKTPVELNDSMEALRAQSSSGVAPAASKRPMRPEELRCIAGALISFGSHALTHPWLTNLTPAEKAREIADSVGRCEALTGSRPSAFAYPYGNFDEESERLVAQAGFDCACSTEHAPVTDGSRPFALPRVQAGNWSARKLARVLRAL